MAEGAGPRSRRPRVSLLVHDLASNQMVRAAPLAEALQADFEVELCGLLLSGDQVYAPYRGRFRVHGVPARFSVASVLAAAPRVAAAARGEVLVACKPLLSTTLAARLTRPRRPWLLDAEDDERAERSVDPGRAWLRRLADPWRVHAGLGALLARGAGAVTVSSRALQRRHGGTLLRHGPSEQRFDPARPELADRAALRQRLGLPVGVPVALFAGIPRRHKGWEVLLEALARREAAPWHLALAGRPSAEFEQARERLGGRAHPLGEVDNARMPELLAAVDAVPVPQLAGRFSEAQLPAKALEALAMQVPLVASRVGDLPEILGDGERGWLVPPGDAAALARALAEIAADPAGAALRTAAGRRWFLTEASVEAMRGRLLPLVWSLLEGRP
jgi:glycosyltransferase involved in cell wall biosynthesis